MTSPKPFKILFLCSGNSARSILAEYMIKKIGRGRFESYSAGSHPRGTVQPMALQVLHDLYKMDVTDARSKSLDEFKNVHFDFIITLCDKARESCPVWPGHPILAHWSTTDPADAEGNEKERHVLFSQVALQIQRRLDLFCSLPFDKISELSLEQETKEIGKK